MLMNEDAITRPPAILLDLACPLGHRRDPSPPIQPILQQEIAALAGLSQGITSTLINQLMGNGTLKRLDAGLPFVTLTLSPLEGRHLASHVIFWAMAHRVGRLSLLHLKWWRSQRRTRVMTAASPVSSARLDRAEARQMVVLALDQLAGREQS